ncbi:MAG TPA: J domain-containing protein [Miltoncostaeaceae bacterium]|nr:J domain-containing protein [Miltoncostaeaceae bacterium]
METDHYATLGVAPDASAEDLHAAWRFSLLAFHPDRFRDAGQRARADDMAKRVNAAWQVLGDPRARARYDRDRREAAARRTGPAVRELPCPACATLSGVPDQDGRAVGVRCPACGQEFEAVVGADLVGRPRLDWRFFGGRHVLSLRDRAGRVRQVPARRLPAELALTEGERVSVVMGPRGARYMVVHGRVTDMGWRVG